MSSIGSIGNSSSIFDALKSNQINSDQLQVAQAGGQDRFETKINDALEAAGVDSETASSLKADLQAAFEDFGSTGSKDPGAMKETVDAIFAEYGLDAEEILGDRAGRAGSGPPPNGPPPNGPPPNGPPPDGGFSASSTDSTSDIETLLELLAQQEGTDSESLVSQLFGIDAEA